MSGIDTYTKLLLHLDGDRSDSNNEVTINGTPTILSYGPEMAFINAQLSVDIGVQGTYDTSFVLKPSIIKDGDTYKMWYGVTDSANLRILYCDSSDGILWASHQLVVDKASQGTYDTTHADGPCVIKDGDTYKMWYGGYNGANYRILYCTSTDGIYWSNFQLVMDINVQGVYDTLHVNTPRVIKDGSTYKMWYTATSAISVASVGLYSTSSDGITWATPQLSLPKGGEGIYDSKNVGPGTVIKQDNGTYKMWYTGLSTLVANRERILVCESVDGISWKNNRLCVDMGTEGVNDINSSIFPYVIRDGDYYKMWYVGKDSVMTMRIIYTEQPIVTMDLGKGMKFNGTTDYLTVADSDDWNFVGGDFTVDCWTYLTAYTGSPYIITQWSAAYVGFILGISSSKLSLFYGNGGSWGVSIVDSVNMPLNTWTHVAVVRTGNDFKLFRNGAVVGTQTVAFTANNYTTPLGIGALHDGTALFYGNIANVRISKGIARWTSTFTPPTSAYTTDSYTKLLLPFSGDDWNNVQPSVGTKINPSTAKFDGAMYFNSSTTAISIADSNDWFLAGDFTIDCWVYTESSSYEYPQIFAQDTNSPHYHGHYINMARHEGNYVLGYHFWPLSANGVESATVKMYYNVPGQMLNQWVHIAVTRCGNIWKLWRNGINVVTGSSWGNDDAVMTDIPANLIIGGSNSYNRFKGYIDEFRISKGIARWTSNFTPPTAAYSETMKGITGYVSPGANITVYNYTDNKLITSVDKPAGNYTIQTPGVNKVNVITILDSVTAPVIKTNISTIELN